MDGVFTQCHAVSPLTGRRCVRLDRHDDEHQDQLARDVHCHRWTDPGSE